MQIDPRNSECPRKVLAVLEPGVPGAWVLHTYSLGRRFPRATEFCNQSSRHALRPCRLNSPTATRVP